MTLLIKEILKLKPKNQLVTAEGWVKNFRANKFISLNDGSTVRNIQCILDFENFDESIINFSPFGNEISAYLNSGLPIIYSIVTGATG